MQLVRPRRDEAHLRDLRGVRLVTAAESPSNP